MFATRQEQLEELRQLIDGIDVAMFTTQDGGRKLHCRPLQTQQMDEEGHLWFLTSKDTSVVGEVQSHPAICLTYASRDRNTYVAVFGRAQQIFDPARIAELWSPANQVFFPEGHDDPDLTLLRVTPERAECWTGPSGAVGRLLAFAAAAVTGDERLLGDKQDLTL